MKKTKYISLLLAVVMLASVLLLAACGKEKPDDTTGDTTPAAPDTTAEPVSDELTIFADGKSEFSVVYASGSSKAQKYAEQIARELSRFTSVTFTAVSDAERPLAEYADSYEILVGMTDRPESSEKTADLRYKDYTATVAGKKIIIGAREESMIKNAATYFIDMVILTQIVENPTNPKVVMSAENSHTYIQNADYVVKSFNINGTPITDYRIVYPEAGPYSARRTALVIRYLISYRAGYLLPIVGDSSVVTANEIIVGKTAHGGEDLSGAAAGSYSVKLEGGNLYISADGMLGYETVCDYFDNEVIKGAEINIDASVAKSGSGTAEKDAELLSTRGGNYRVMFYNILGNCDTSKYPTRERNQLAAEILISLAPDVFGLQECSPNSRGAESIIKTLDAAGYSEVSVTVNNSNGVNYTPLLYNRAKFRVVDKGYVLFTGTASNDKSKSITWAVFEEIEGGKRFAVCSTHYNYKADANADRVKNAAQLVELNRTIAEKYNCPIISGGDLNCRADSEPFLNMLASGMQDLWTVSPVKEDLKTTHAYPTWNSDADLYFEYATPNGGYSAAIDHAVLYNGEKVIPKLFNVITLKYALLAADHCPLVVDFDIN